MKTTQQIRRSQSRPRSYGSDDQGKTVPSVYQRIKGKEEALKKGRRSSRVKGFSLLGSERKRERAES